MSMSGGVATEIGTTTPDRIDVRGKDLAREIIGKFDFVDMICWLVMARLPEPREKDMLNMFLVTGADHGLTPSAISARLTYLGAPESLQGAVAAGLLGAGDNFLGTVQNAADAFTRFAQDLDDEADGPTVEAAARRLIESYRSARRPIPGVGHPIHIDGDPRIPALIEVSRRNGYYGKHWRLAQAVPATLRSDRGRNLPLNAAGGLGAALAAMALPAQLGRGLALIGRAAGLVAHLVEERDRPIGQGIWDLVLRQDSRNVVP